ncbi:YbaL family putative K(+) efflux transporter [Sandaracinobacteroides sp. A072]|uniref:YbaL family putative K(+) efflux transporter n=1 Tax=Sandaracinobacteroides sp. A072 TaxID=3461146 RepID=UPI004040EA5E
MPEHQTPLIATIAAGLALAYLFGLVAHRLKAPPLVGYLVAGIIVGPFTPGFVADQELALELAEIGVILLMFGVGLHFSLKDLLSVSRIAIPGAVAQISAATVMGAGLGYAMGWPLSAGLVFGLSLSVASTVVLVRALQERRIIETERGRIAVGWLVVEDLAVILALVMLPVLATLGTAGGGSVAAIAGNLVLTLAKVAAFIALMLVVGRRVIPWLMHYTAHTGSRELFRLAVYAIALGIAFVAAKMFDASFALGAFFAGIVLGETRLSQRATEEAMPLRDAFAVLFFVSVGMLFDPRILIDQPLAVLGTVAIIILGKSLAAYLIVTAFGRPRSMALMIAASLAQIGEFSFILAGMAVALGLMEPMARDLILAGALMSILLNPLAFRFAKYWSEGRAQETRDLPEPAAEQVPAPEPEPDPQQPTLLSGHDVIIGYGRVGSFVGARLLAAGRPVLVIEDRDDALALARRDGAETLEGNAADPRVLALANLAGALRLYVTVPEPYEAGQVVQQARAINPGLGIYARAHSDDDQTHLDSMGATLTILGEREIAERMLEQQAGLA